MKKLTFLAALISAVIGFSTPSWAESDNGTVLPTAGSITDFWGRTWTLTQDSQRAVKLDGVASNLTNILEVWYLDHTVYAFDGTQWWAFLNTWSPPTAVAMTALPPLITTPGLRAPVGPQTGVSCTGTNISAGGDIQAAVDANPANTTFCLATGTYSQQTVTPKEGDVFIGAYDGTNYAVMDGGGMQGVDMTTISTATTGGSLAAGTYWYTVTALNGTGETAMADQLTITTTGSASTITLNWNAVSGATGYRVYRGTSWFGENTYYDVGAVTTFTDTGAAGTSQNAPEVNTAGGAALAFAGSADYVVVRNLKITNYNNATQAGQLDMSGKYFVLMNNEISFATQGAGFRSSAGHALILSNHLYKNAEEGYSLQGGANVMDNNDIDTNNPTDSNWDGSEQGGGKAFANKYLSIWYNYSHANGGPGFWTDYDNIYVNYLYNRTLANMASGIEHEISYNMLVKGNYFEGDGADPGCPGNYATCGEVEFENSLGVPAGSQYAGLIEITDNVLKPGAYGRAIYGRMQNRGNGDTYYLGPFWIRNLWVHHNFVDMSGSTVQGQVGIERDTGDTAVYTSNNNKWDYNTYKLNSSVNNFAWISPLGASDWSWSSWQASGQDLHGSIIP